MFDLYVYLFRVCIHLDDRNAAHEAFIDAEKLSHNERFSEYFSNNCTALTHTKLALSFARLQLAESTDEKTIAIAQAREQLANTSLSAIRITGRVGTRLAAELIDEELDLVISIIQISRLPKPTVLAIKEMGNALHEWVPHNLVTQFRSDQTVYFTGVPANISRQDWFNWVALNSSNRDGVWIIHLLEKAGDPPDLPACVRKALIAYLHGVEELSELQEYEEFIGQISSLKNTLLQAIVASFNRKELEEFTRKIKVNWRISNSGKYSFQEQVFDFINHVFSEGFAAVEELCKVLIKERPYNQEAQNLRKLVRNLEIFEQDQ